MKFEVLCILCRFFIDYFIANHLNISFSILIIWIGEESSDFFLLQVRRYYVVSVGGRVLLLLGAWTVYVVLLWPSLGQIKLLKIHIWGVC